MKMLYYIIPDLGTLPDKAKNLPYKMRIIEVPEKYSIYYRESPSYESLNDLKRKDPLYNHLKQQNPKGARRIAEPKFIISMADVILTPWDEEFNKYSAEILIHSIHGKIQDNLTGIHFKSNFNKNLEIIEILNKPDKNGVWVASVKVYSETKKKWFEKKEPSTFFPESWSPTHFMFETYCAIKNKRKVDGTDYKYISETTSGIPVEICFKEDGMLATIYPLYL